jgi:hypothetical protein
MRCHRVRSASHVAPAVCSAATASGASHGRTPWNRSATQKWNGGPPTSTRPSNRESGSAVLQRKRGSSPSLSTAHCSDTIVVPVAIVSSSCPASDSASATPITHSSLIAHSAWSVSRGSRANAAITSPTTSGACAPLAGPAAPMAPASAITTASAIKPPPRRSSPSNATPASPAASAQKSRTIADGSCGCANPCSVAPKLWNHCASCSKACESALIGVAAARVRAT